MSFFDFIDSEEVYVDHNGRKIPKGDFDELYLEDYDEAKLIGDLIEIKKENESLRGKIGLMEKGSENLSHENFRLQKAVGFSEKKRISDEKVHAARINDLTMIANQDIEEYEKYITSLHDKITNLEKMLSQKKDLESNVLESFLPNIPK